MLEIKKEKYDYYYKRIKTPVQGARLNTQDIPLELKIPIVTVCYLLTENGIVGRGISVCSEQDTYNEIIGKQLAKGHALRAIKGRHLDNFKRKEVINRLTQCKCPFTRKGERNPELSWWERKFLFGAKNMSTYIKGIGFCKLLPAEERAVAIIDVKLRQNLFAIRMRQYWFEKNMYSKFIHQPKG